MYQVARQVILNRLPVTAITNDLEISKLFMEYKEADRINLGGGPRKGAHTLLGGPWLSFLKTLHTDICFWGIKGIAHEHLRDSSLEVSDMKRCILGGAGIKILLADSIKFGDQGFRDACS